MNGFLILNFLFDLSSSVGEIVQELTSDLILAWVNKALVALLILLVIHAFQNAGQLLVFFGLSEIIFIFCVFFNLFVNLQLRWDCALLFLGLEIFCNWSFYLGVFVILRDNLVMFVSEFVLTEFSQDRFHGWDNFSPPELAIIK